MQFRKVGANRQIVTTDINNINDSQKANFDIVLRDMLGITQGVITGLTHVSHTGLNLTIALGAISDGVTFRELLTNSTIALPNADGTYKIYLSFNQKDDLPVSGFQLLNTATQQTEYNVINTRTYDSFNILSSITPPANSFIIGQAVVATGVITSYTDLRTFTEFGRIAIYSLQKFTEINRNTASRTNNITGKIINDTDLTSNIWLDIAIDNSHAGKGIQVNAGTNIGAVGINLISNNNVGVLSNLTNNAIGFKSLIAEDTIGFLSEAKTGTVVNTIGFKSNNNSIGFYSYANVANAGGFIYQGSGNLVTGQLAFYSAEAETGLFLSITNQIEHQAKIETINDASHYLKSGLNISTTGYGRGIQIDKDGIDALTDDQYYGIYGRNLNGNGSGTFIKINDGDSTIKNYNTGIDIQKSNYGIRINNSKYNGIYLLDNQLINSIPLFIESRKGVGSSTAITQYGQVNVFDNAVVGLNIKYSSSTDGIVNGDGIKNSAITINSDTGNTGKMCTAIDISGYKNSGIFLTQSAGFSSAIAVSSSGAGVGLNVFGQSSGNDASSAIGTTNILRGLNYYWEVSTTNVGFALHASGSTNWSSTSNLTGVDLLNLKTGLKVFDCKFPIIIDRTTQGGTIGIDVNNVYTGYSATNGQVGFLANNNNKGFEASNNSIAGVYSHDNVVGFFASNTNNIHLHLEPRTSLPSSPSDGDIVMMRNPSTNINQLIIYQSNISSWKGIVASDTI